jgi:hypothetical protein
MGKMKAAVLGLGPSLALYKPEGYDITIGVNDIWRYFKTDVVCCFDEREMFIPDRIEVIDSSKPQAFYSHLDCYSGRADFKRVELLPYFPTYICQVDLPALPKSMTSTFIATVIAYRFYQAEEIHLYGADMRNHPNLDEHMCREIKNHFIKLKQVLKEKGTKLVVFGSGILADI